MSRGSTGPRHTSYDGGAQAVCTPQVQTFRKKVTGAPIILSEFTDGGNGCLSGIKRRRLSQRERGQDVVLARRALVPGGRAEVGFPVGADVVLVVVIVVQVVEQRRRRALTPATGHKHVEGK